MYPEGVPQPEGAGCELKRERRERCSGVHRCPGIPAMVDCDDIQRPCRQLAAAPHEPLPPRL